MIHCAKCGVVPVPKDQLPVKLPEVINFNVKGNPLDADTAWKNTTCPPARAMRCATPTRWIPSRTHPGISPASPIRISMSR
jgi:leucyl-tRNA synthetase